MLNLNEYDVYAKTVTPDMAKTLLKGNIGNRNTSKSHVSHIAKQMLRGRWKLTPSPIILTKGGRILDGQHRLLGCLLSGCTVNFTFTVVPDDNAEEIFSVLDQGKKRTLEDLTKKPAKLIKPLVYLLRAGLRITSPTVEDLEPFLDSEIGSVLNEFVDCKSKMKLWRANHFIASMVIAVMNRDVTLEEAKETYQRLTQDDITTWPPVFRAVYVRLAEDRRHMSGMSLDNPVFMCSYYAWKHLHKGTKSVRITGTFIKNTKADVYSALYNICPEISN